MDCRSYNELLSQARSWEQSGEYLQAVNFYLRLNSSNCPDRQVLLQSWEKVQSRFIITICVKE